MNPSNSDQIRDAIFAGKKIRAIKLQRTLTGMGLKDAKEAVEKLEAELRISSPDQFSQTPQGNGCSAMIALCGGLGVALGWLVHRIA